MLMGAIMRSLTSCTPWSVVGVLLLSLFVAMPLIAADAPNLDDLERRIEAAKREEGEKAEAMRQRVAADATKATLVVHSDAVCRLRVNGATQGVQEPGVTRRIRVSPGEQLIECASTEHSRARVQQVKTVGSGAQAVVVLELGSEIERRQITEQRAKDSAACAGNAACMVNAGTAILRQPATGLEWTQADNGSDINWSHAREHCAGKGRGWRLPTNDELYAIYDPNGSLTTACKSMTCKVSPLLRLTGYWFWSGDRSGSSSAWYVYLNDGNRAAYVVSSLAGFRALCVRAT